MTFAGAVGVLRWGYYAAGTLRYWRIGRTTGGVRRLTASIVTVDPMRSAQRPLAFEAVTEQGVWTWPILTCTITGPAFVATLGPRQAQTTTDRRKGSR